MTPILCISKTDMPRMMYELGKASNVYFDTILAVICFIIMMFFMVKAIENIPYSATASKSPDTPLSSGCLS